LWKIVKSPYFQPIFTACTEKLHFGEQPFARGRKTNCFPGRKAAGFDDSQIVKTTCGEKQIPSDREIRFVRSGSLQFYFSLKNRDSPTN